MLRCALSSLRGPGCIYAQSEPSWRQEAWDPGPHVPPTPWSLGDLGLAASPAQYFRLVSGLLRLQARPMMKPCPFWGHCHVGDGDWDIPEGPRLVVWGNQGSLFPTQGGERTGHHQGGGLQDCALSSVVWSLPPPQHDLGTSENTRRVNGQGCPV